MRCLPFVFIALVSFQIHGAPSQDGLIYRAKALMEGQDHYCTVRFRVTLQGPRVTANRKQLPRFGSWRAELLETPPGMSGTLLLTRLQRLMYVGDVAAGMSPTGRSQRWGGTRCRVWRLATPPTVRAVAELAELRRGMLALSRLKGAFPAQGFRDLDVTLEKLTLPKVSAPLEEGTALLATLNRAAQAPVAVAGPEVVE